MGDTSITAVPGGLHGLTNVLIQGIPTAHKSPWAAETDRGFVKKIVVKKIKEIKKGNILVKKDLFKDKSCVPVNLAISSK